MENWKNKRSETWKNSQSEALFEAFTKVNTADEAARFCRDLMTANEIEELAGRWAVARELDKGTPQRQTSEKTGVSIATVTRVNKWLKRGKGGYRLVLDRLSTSVLVE